jgi:hypothetical protein
MGHVLGGRVTVIDGDCRLLQLSTYHYTIVYISYDESNLPIAYPHESMSCLCPRNQAAFPLKSGVLLLARDPS